MNDSRTQEAIFEEGIQDYLEAFNAGDYRRVASFWTEDAVHQPPMGPEIRGRAVREGEGGVRLRCFAAPP